MKNTIIKIIRVIVMVVLALSLIFGGLFFYNSYKKQKEAKELASEVKAPLNIQSGEELPQNPIDFNELQKKNEDIYAWITIENTQVDYPIVQAYEEDDGFYLNHNINKQYDINGSIYTERANSLDFSDSNTVIYGHNMLDGSMFQNLHKFRDKKFFDENKYIYIYTKGHILKYEIFAAYKSDNRHILNSYDFTKDGVFKEYLKKAQNPPSLEVNRRDLNLSENDKIITLSTCIGNETQYRYLVQGVLINDTITK